MQFLRRTDTVRKKRLRDVIGGLAAHSIPVPDKLEGVGLTFGAELYLATDDGGVDESSGETLFFRLGH